MSGRHPPLCCNLTLIAMQGHQTTNSNKNVVCFLPIYSGRQVRRMYQPGVTQGEGHTGFLIHHPSAAHAFICLARRIQPIISLVDREVAFLCTNGFIVLHLLGILIHLPGDICLYFYFYFIAGRIQPILTLVDLELEFSTCWSFLVRKNPSYRDSNSCASVSEGYEVSN